MSKTVRVFEVCYHVSDDSQNAHGGAAGDGSFVERFRKQADAERFAVGKEFYGRPATVRVDDVPRRVAQRWGI